MCTGPKAADNRCRWVHGSVGPLWSIYPLTWSPLTYSALFYIPLTCSPLTYSALFYIPLTCSLLTYSALVCICVRTGSAVDRRCRVHGSVGPLRERRPRGEER